MRMKINPGKILRSMVTPDRRLSSGQLADFIIKASYNMNPLKILLLPLNDLAARRTQHYHFCGASHG